MNDGLVVVGMPGRQYLASANLLGVSIDAGHELLRESRSEAREVGEEEVGVQWPVEDVDRAPELHSATPAAMDAALHQAGCLRALLTKHPRIGVLAFYLSPWEAFLEASADGDMSANAQVSVWMQAWARFHETLLAARMLAPERVLLVNAGRLESPDDVRSHLRALGAHMTDAESSIPSSPTSPLNPLLSGMLAAHMADAGREYWNIYEALESCAVLSGREPEFQGTANLVNTRDLGAILVSLANIQRASVAQGSGVDESFTTSMESVQGCSLQSAQDHMHLIQLENELLNLQLHELYTELDYHVGANAELRDIVIQAGEAADSARRLIAQLYSIEKDRASS